MAAIPAVIPITTPRAVAPANHQKREGLVGALLQVKRRTSQALLMRVGATAARLEDPEYDALWDELCSTEADFERLGESFGRFADTLQTWTHASRVLSAGANQFFSSTSKRHSSSGDDAMHEFAQTVASFADASSKVDDSIRRHVTKQYIERVIAPVRNMVVEQIPLLKKQHTARAGFATDVSSYRRRLDKQRKKLQKDGGRKTEDLIATLEAKLNAAEENFHNLDETLKREIEWVLSNKHSLVHKQTIFCMCCYRDFYKRANDEFGRVVDQLDEGVREEALKKLAEAHASGPLAPPEDARSAAERLYDQGTAKLDAKAAAASQVLEKRAKKKKIAKQNREIRSRIADTSAKTTLGGGSGTIPPPPPVGARGILEVPRDAGGGDSAGGGAYGGRSSHVNVPDTPPGSDAEGDEDVINPLPGMSGMEVGRARAMSLKSSSASAGDSASGRPLVAQFSYDAAEVGELAFEQGEVVVVTAEDESGWGMGHVKGRPEVEGVFPLNYLSDAAQ
jgi:hypothetical protein